VHAHRKVEIAEGVLTEGIYRTGRRNPATPTARAFGLDGASRPKSGGNAVEMHDA